MCCDELHKSAIGDVDDSTTTCPVGLQRKDGAVYESIQCRTPWTVSGFNWALKRKITGRQHMVAKQKRE